jgi:hypothetical protein
VAQIGAPDATGLPHPRSFGNFPRVIAKYVKQRNVLTLTEAIRKMTGWPAARMRLANRGTIDVGNWADVTIFDYDTIQDNATYEKPMEFPTGIDWVLVNGVVTIDRGKHTGAKAGKVLWGARNCLEAMSVFARVFVWRPCGSTVLASTIVTQTQTESTDGNGDGKSLCQKTLAVAVSVCARSICLCPCNNCYDFPGATGKAPRGSQRAGGLTRSIGAGRATRVGGCSLRSFNASCTARSSCGSWPFATSAAEYSTWISGVMPWFSTAQCPLIS